MLLGVAVTAVQPGSERGPAIIGLDHVPIAVRDLEKAADAYRGLGFALKPGRPHSNGIRNQHVKFPDGTELELITAPEARDSLTTKYRRHLENGDGPAFLALYIPDKARVPEDLHPSLGYLFFGLRNASPTDRPEHFAHANTAYALTRVWLAGDDLSAERRLLAALGATIRREAVEFPDRVDAEVAALPEGSVVLLPGRFQIVRGRPIVGLTVAVRDLDTAATFAGASARRTASSVFVDPRDALGYRLELRAR